MSVKREEICRLCLKVTESECNDVDETTKLMFDILMLKLDLDITRDPVVCQDCMGIARKCLDFKYTCVKTETILLSFAIATKEAKHDIEVLCKGREDAKAVVDEDFNICRFCKAQFGSSDFVSLKIFMNDAVFDMLSGHLPEMDFNVIQNPIICTTCKEMLEGYFQFVLHCLNVEWKLKVYYKQERSDSKHQIELCNVICFLIEDILEYSNQTPQIRIIKQESNKLQVTERMCPEACSGLIKQEELDIKEETDEYTCQQGGQANILKDSSFHRDDLEVKRIEGTDIQLNHQVVCSDEGEQSNYVKSNLTSTNDASDMDVYKCAERVSDPKHQNYANGSSFIAKKCQNFGTVHRDISKTKIYKGELFTGDSNYKITYKSHKDISEIKMFTCSLCAYETKHRRSIARHVLVHKDISEIKMLKCPLCANEFKYKGNLKTHMLVHKDASDIKKFTCLLCGFETKYKSSLAQHMLIHKDTSEITIFKCFLCTYETKRKYDLTKHMLVHKDDSERRIFTCSLCAYKSHLKRCLANHMLLHKDVSEIKMYTCSLCTFESKHKRSLERHMLIHINFSELEMFTCSLCAFKSKHKGNLTKHLMLVHKDVS